MVMDRSVEVRPGRPVRLIDVARAADVAKSTAAEALAPGSGGRNVRVGEETARRVREIARQLGYRPNQRARALARQKPHAVGILFARTGPFFTGLYGQLLELLPQHLIEHDLNLVLIPAIAEPEVWQNQLLDQRIDGCFVMQPMPAGVGEVLGAQRLPGVLINDRHPGTPAPQVLLDDAAGMGAVMDHLFAQGHRRIAYLGPRDTLHYSNQLRPQTMAQRLSDAGLPADAAHRWERVEDAVAELAGARPGERPTAVVCHADTLAVQLIGAVHRAGLCVPRDVSVVGFNDEHHVRDLVPALTTVRPALAALARRSVELLVAAMTDPGGPTGHSEHWIAEQLIVRESTAAPSV